MRRLRAPLVAALAGALAACGSGGRAPQPGSTLLHAFGDPDGNGVLDDVRGQPLLPRTELAPAARVARTLATFAQISDIHVTDEESPLRVEALDRVGGRVASAFRPQESLTAQVLAATLKAVDGLHPQAVLLTGDLVDNDQENELDWLLAALRGGVVHPDSGAPGYDGVQAASSADPFLYRPDIDAPRHPGLLAAAQQAFRSPGLIAPWLPLVSNHDVLVQGNVPADPRLDAIATGASKVVEVTPASLDAARAAASAAAALDDVDRFAARRIAVAPDPERRLVAGGEVVRRLASAAHVGTEDGRLAYARRLAPGVVLVALDTADRAGGADGVLPDDELRWLARTLAVQRGERILVASPTPLELTRGGEQALALLDRTPRVVAVLAGDTHRALITPRRAPNGGYWLVRCPSLADYPQEARFLRLVELADGRAALETFLVDQAGRRGAAGYLGLAGTSRDLAFLDPQGGRPAGDAGTPADRNATLFLPS
jgi:3',5'-cyclic AMP phosphodiesterase CpdA